jgi:hypothetical protein
VLRWGQAGGNHLALAHYTADPRRLVFTETDFLNGGSDRLPDASSPGETKTIAVRVREHINAGADHVRLRVRVPK